MNRSTLPYVPATLLVLFSLLMVGCDGLKSDTTSGSTLSDSPIQNEEEVWDGETLFVSAPTMRPNPVERAPLVGILEFESPIAVNVRLEITDGTLSWEQPPITPAGRKHRIAVMGMRPNREHTIVVHVSTPSGKMNEQSEPIVFTTPPVPDSFPPISTILAEPEKMVPGVTVFAVNLWRDDVSMLDYGYIIAMDEMGRVVWFCNTQDRIADMQILSNGNILYQHGSYRVLREIDIMGRDIRTWYTSNLTESPNDGAIPVAVDTLHHAVSELPNGNFLSLSTELREFDAYPSSEKDPDAPWHPADVVCDIVVEFDPDTGEVVSRLPLADLLDPKRFGFMALGGFWKDKYDSQLQIVSRDWSHANALQFLPEENAILVSFRHLDCVMKIDWTTHKIQWILGDPSGWGQAWEKYLLKPKGEVRWSYHQHAPQVTANGTLVMYDNGNFRTRPYGQITPAAENQSRVVEYRIDEAAMTVEQVYEFWGTEGDSFFCPFYCEADLLPGERNMLITNGGHIELDDGTPHDIVPGEHQWARIIEIRKDTDPENATGGGEEKVFEMICDSGLNSPYGWSIYRAIRIPNLYDSFRFNPPVSDEEIVIFPRDKLIPTKLQ